MKFSEFQATGRDVPDIRIVRSIYAAIASDDKPLPGRIYVDDLYIESDVFTDGVQRYFLTIGNSSEASTDLPKLERQLFDFAVSEGYIDGPTTEEELIDALQGLMNYIGGWDAPEGHPCRVAADLLARLS